MSLAEVLAEDRRLVILRCLSDVAGFHLNEGVLMTAVRSMGHAVGRDLVRADIGFLSTHGLVRREVLKTEGGELWLVHLTDAGEQVAKGQPHPGVARLGPA